MGWDEGLGGHFYTIATNPHPSARQAEFDMIAIYTANGGKSSWEQKGRRCPVSNKKKSLRKYPGYSVPGGT